MESFFDSIDYDFFIKVWNTSETYLMITNHGVYEDEPSDDTKKTITHLRTTYVKSFELQDYVNLKYLEYYIIFKSIKLSIPTNLETLIMYFDNIDNSNLENLPNIKTLIFTNMLYLIICEKGNFKLNNLPMTLEKIIFLGNGNFPNVCYQIDFKNKYKIIKMLKKKIRLYKLPYGCQVYFIDCENKIHTIKSLI